MPPRDTFLVTLISGLQSLQRGIGGNRVFRLGWRLGFLGHGFPDVGSAGPDQPRCRRTQQETSPVRRERPIRIPAAHLAHRKAPPCSTWTRLFGNLLIFVAPTTSPPSRRRRPP